MDLATSRSALVLDSGGAGAARSKRGVAPATKHIHLSEGD